MNASDQLAYQVGRAIVDLHITKQALEQRDAEIEALRARVAELEAERAES